MRYVIRPALLAVCLLLLGVPAAADPPTEAELRNVMISAAKSGDVKAQLLLGASYASGSGGYGQDAKEAAKWYEMAAERGNATAQYNLGMMYANGDGVQQIYESAYFWLTVSSNQGNPYATAALKTILDKLTPRQKAEADKLVAEWKPLPHK